MLYLKKERRKTSLLEVYLNQLVEKISPFAVLKLLSHNEVSSSANTWSDSNKEESLLKIESQKIAAIFSSIEVFASENIDQHLEDLDKYLSLISYSICLNSNKNDEKELKQFGEIISDCLSQDLLNLYLRVMEETYVVSDVFSHQELFFVEILARNITSFGIWKSVFFAKERKKNSSQSEVRAYVEAVALDFSGNIIATGYRGELIDQPKLHAEQVLIKKLEKMGANFEQVIVCTNLEPCGTRSYINSGVLEGDLRGCSVILKDKGVRIVGYALEDNNPSGNGKSHTFLKTNGMWVLKSNVDKAQKMTKDSQNHRHFHSSAPTNE